MRQVHLNKSGFGMGSKTACGRNAVNTPISTNWEGFKKTNPAHQCERCAASKQAAINAKADANKSPTLLDTLNAELDAGVWEPMVDTEAWKAADAALIAKKK